MMTWNRSLRIAVSTMGLVVGGVGLADEVNDVSRSAVQVAALAAPSGALPSSGWSAPPAMAKAGPVQARALQSGYASAWVSGLGVAPAAIPEASLVASNQQLLLLAPAGPLNSAGFAPIKAAQALQGGGGAAHAAQSARLFLYPATR